MKLFTFYIGISASLSQTIIGKDLHEIFLKGENLSFRSKIGYFYMILSGGFRGPLRTVCSRTVDTEGHK